MKKIIGAVLVSSLFLSASVALAGSAKCTSDAECEAGTVCVPFRGKDLADGATGNCLGETEPLAVEYKEMEAAKAAGAPVNKAKPGLVTGAIFDLVGFGFIVGAGAASAAGPEMLGLSMGFLYGGGGLLAMGSIISSISMQVRHNAYVDAGYSPPGGRKAGAWTLTVLTVGCYGGGMGMTLASGGDTGLIIGGMSTVALGAILEVVNIMSVRMKWDGQLKRSAISKEPKAAVAPVVYAFESPDTGAANYMLGVAGKF